MRTTTQDTSAVVEELETLGQALCRSIGADRYEEAERITARCAELHTVETHQAILAIFERARRLVLARRSFQSSQLAGLERASQYIAGHWQDPQHPVSEPRASL